MKRISHITDITALKNADLPILSITLNTQHNKILPTHLDKKRTEKHISKKQKPFSKQHKQKGIALKKKRFFKNSKRKRALYYEQK